MASFKFERRRFYPDLDLEVRLDVNPYRQLSFTAQATVKAKGAPGARQRWRDEFWNWAQDRDLDAFAPRFGNRRIDGTSVYDCYLKDWRIIADFIVMWIGIDALSEALTERGDIEERLGKEVQCLSKSVLALAEKVAVIEQLCRSQDEAWRRLRMCIVSSEPLRINHAP